MGCCPPPPPDSSALVPKGPRPASLKLCGLVCLLWPTCVLWCHVTPGVSILDTPVMHTCPAWPWLGVPVACGSVPTVFVLSREPLLVFRVPCPRAPASSPRGARVAWVHGPYSHGPVPVRCLPPWAAGAPCPGLPQLPPGLGLASPHSRGHVPPASPAIGLKWPSGPPSARDRVAPATLRTTLPRQNKPDPVKIGRAHV